MHSSKTTENFNLALYKAKAIKYNAAIKFFPGKKHFPGNQKIGRNAQSRKGEFKMKKVLALLIALVMLAACFAGCSSSEKTIVVGCTIYSPMNYYDENNELIGFDTELATKVFENLGYKVMFQIIDWNSKYTDLDSGAIDCVWNGFTANTADPDGVLRAEKVDFSYNYMENRQVIVTTANSGITSAEDLADKMAAVESGSAGETYAKSFEGVNVKGFLQQTDCLMEVKSGAADFAVLDAQLAKSYCGKGDYTDLMIVDGLSSNVEFYAIGFKKGSELTAKVNEQLEKLAADGTIAQLAEKYGVSNTAITDFSDQK